MDLHDGLGDGGEQGRWEPPGFGSETAPTAADDGIADPSGYDGSGGDGSGGYEDAGGDTGTVPGEAAARGTMIVEVDGEKRELPAERDYTGDGRPDAAVETPDGRVVVFSDSADNETGAAEPDGRADEAWIVDKSTGRVVGEAHVQPGTGGWVDGDAGAGGGSS